MNIETVVIDYKNEIHASDLLFLMDEYAKDPMGGNEPISQFVVENLASELSKIPYAFSVICYIDDKPVGLANCFEAFSTFKCKPLINIHDLVVMAKYRGQRISQHLLRKIEDVARDKNCCKITLEVLEGNKTAQNAYRKYGFEPYQLDIENGDAQFWQKPVSHCETL